MARFGPPYLQVRIERPWRWQWIESLPGLLSIDLEPAASGPEIELTFGTAPGSLPADEDFMRRAVCEATGHTVLAIRRKGDAADA